MLWPPALRGVFSLNPKITKLLAEREKNSEKIAKLNARNDEIDKQVTELEKRSWKGLGLSARLLLVLLLLVMFGMGIQNYRESYGSYEQQKVETDKTLDLIGTPEEDVQMVTNGVKHLGWTVLYYYYPDNEIVNGDYNQAESDRFWYFTPDAMSDEAVAGLQQDGYQVSDYGQMQLAQYPFYLYYIEAVQPASFAKSR